MTATNTFSEAEAVTGGFTVTKAVVDGSVAGVEASRAYVFEYSVDGGAWSALAPVGAGGSVSVAGLADGAVVGLREVAPAGLPEGVVWGGVSFSSGSSFVIDTDSTTDLAVTATNTFSADDGEQSATGGFSLSKALVGLAPTDFAPDTFFEIRYSVNGEETPEPIRMSADGTIAVGPQDLKAGSVVTFQEVTPTNTPAGFEWTGATIVPASLTVVADTSAAVTVTNGYRIAGPGLGAFNLHKVISGDAAALVPDDTVFTVDYFLDGAAVPAGTLELDADGTVVSVTGIPVGTVVTLVERAPAGIDGARWGPSVFSPASLVVSETTVDVSLTNTITVTDGGGGATGGGGGGDSRDLPMTGFQAGSLVGLTALLLGAGTFLLLVGRRHGRHRAS